MKKHIKTAILLLVFSQVFAQNVVQKPQELLIPSKKWILTNNRIEKNEILLSSYKTSKLRANTFVISFIANGKIEYDYETNFAFKSDGRIEFLDLNTEESAWDFDSLNNQLSLTIKGGYSSLEDFKFKRSYSIERTPDGYVLRKAGEEFYEDLKQKTRLEKAQIALNKKNEAILLSQQVVSKKKVIVNAVQKVENVIPQISNIQSTISPKTDSVVLQKIDSKVVNENLPIQNISVPIAEPIVVPKIETVIAPIVVIDYAARSRDLLDKSKRWMLVKNKIERNDIFLTTYSESKLTINNLVLSFDDGKIAYDYESDPKIKFCAGVDFLDIDTDETEWKYNAERNIITLTLKGGYASLDDFKFKREYWVEIIEDGYILRKLKEHYFNDFRKPIKKKSVK